MLFQKLNREDPEKIFIIVKAGDATNLLVGRAACFDLDSFDGNLVESPATANLNLPAGIVVANAGAAGDYMIVQVYGPCLAAVDGTTGLGAGDQLQISNASGGVLSLQTSEVGKGTVRPAFVAGEAYTTGSAAEKQVFVRTLG